MPVKKRLAKGRAHRLTIKAIEAYRTVLKLEPTWDAHRNGCPTDHTRTRCDTCVAYLHANTTVHLELGIPPWHPRITDVDAPEPPTWASPSSPWAQDWAEIWETRQALDEAVRDA